MAKLKYIGKGTFLVGVPSRDLTAEEVKKFDADWLLASGLYEAPVQKTKHIEPETTITEEETWQG